MIHKVELDEIRLKPIMDFLYDRCLVGEEDLDKDERSYFVTNRGLSVLKVVGPLVKNAKRIQLQNYEAISDALSVVQQPKIEEDKKTTKKLNFSDLLKS
jgi:hypothetical protein